MGGPCKEGNHAWSASVLCRKVCSKCFEVRDNFEHYKEAADIVRRLAKGDYCAWNGEYRCQECLSCESRSYLDHGDIMPKPIEHADDCPYENARAWVSRNGKGE